MYCSNVLSSIPENDSLKRNIVLEVHLLAIDARRKAQRFVSLFGGLSPKSPHLDGSRTLKVRSAYRIVVSQEDARYRSSTLISCDQDSLVSARLAIFR